MRFAVCGWEYDPVQSEGPTFAGGANQSRLNATRVLWQQEKNRAVMAPNVQLYNQWMDDERQLTGDPGKIYGAYQNYEPTCDYR